MIELTHPPVPEISLMWSLWRFVVYLEMHHGVNWEFIEEQLWNRNRHVIS